MTITPATLKSLQVLADHPQGIRPREFAHVRWPDSDGWQRSSRAGANGSHRGGGMYLTAGGHLGKLVNAGLAARNYRDPLDTSVSITEAGRQALKDAEA